MSGWIWTAFIIAVYWLGIIGAWRSGRAAGRADILECLARAVKKAPEWMTKEPIYQAAHFEITRELEAALSPKVKIVPKHDA